MSEHLFSPYCDCASCKQVMFDYEYKMYCQVCHELRSDCECEEDE